MKIINDNYSLGLADGRAEEARKLGAESLRADKIESCLRYIHKSLDVVSAHHKIACSGSNDVEITRLIGSMKSRITRSTK